VRTQKNTRICSRYHLPCPTRHVHKIKLIFAFLKDAGDKDLRCPPTRNRHHTSHSSPMSGLASTKPSGLRHKYPAARLKVPGASDDEKRFFQGQYKKYFTLAKNHDGCTDVWLRDPADAVSIPIPPLEAPTRAMTRKVSYRLQCFYL
jgi:hypothetical protein